VRIVVCIKQVPGTTSVALDPKTNTLVRTGIESIINPFDTHALEEGVRLKERSGGALTVITMGPPQAEQALRDAISLGADEALLLSDPAFAGSDTLSTSHVLAAALSKLGFDIALCGRQTVDGDTGQVGPELSQHLGVPFLAYVSKVEAIEDGCVRVERMVEDGHEVLEASLPAVMSVVKEINVPRLPSLRGMARSKSAKVPVWNAADLGIDPEAVGLAGSPTRVVRVFTPKRIIQGEILTGTADAQVETLVERLAGARLV